MAEEEDGLDYTRIIEDLKRKYEGLIATQNQIIGILEERLEQYQDRNAYAGIG